MKTPIELVKYEQACEDITNLFARKYFGKDVEVWFVADNTTGSAIIGDYSFFICDMYKYLREKYTRKDMIEHYDYMLKCIEEKKTPFNIKNWRAIKKSRLNNKEYDNE